MAEIVTLLNELENTLGKVDFNDLYNANNEILDFKEHGPCFTQRIPSFLHSKLPLVFLNEGN